MKFALSEATEVILFGYSGFDNHLNMLLRPYLNAKALRIVEWSGAGEQQEREQYWESKLGQAEAVVRLDNVTEFVDW